MASLFGFIDKTENTISTANQTITDMNILTTRGDLLTRGATGYMKLPVGTQDNQLLCVDSNTASKLNWKGATGLNIVTLSDTQTLTNKTLTNPFIYMTGSDRILFNVVGTSTTSKQVFCTDIKQDEPYLGAQILKIRDNCVFETETQTLSNKTLTSPVISTISNTGTITLPTSTTTLVGRNTTDTLTNKTLVDPYVANAFNSTIGMYLYAGGNNSTVTNLYSSQTANRNITLPDATTTLVGTDTTDTLSNKTFSSTVNVSSGDLNVSNGYIFAGGTNRPAAPATKGIYLGCGGGSNDSAIEIVANGSSDFSYIDLTYLNQDQRGRIQYAHSTDTMSFNTGASSRLTLNSTAANFNVGITLPTTGGTPSALNYCEDGTFSCTWGAGSAWSATITITFNRIGKRVTLQIPDPGTSYTTTATGPLYSTSVIPSRLRPYSYHVSSISTYQNGVGGTNGECQVLTNGTLYLYYNYNTNWTTGNVNSGYSGFSVTYITS